MAGEIDLNRIEGDQRPIKEILLNEFREVYGYAEKYQLPYAMRLLKRYIEEVEKLS